ncbi:hypothetical protein HDU82_009229, partial [Entophlyctis luteolus]
IIGLIVAGAVLLGIVIAAIIFCYVRKLLCFGVRGNGLSLEEFGKAMSTKEKRLAPPTPQEVAQNRLRIYNATGKIVYSDRELASSLPPYQSNSAANFNRNFNYNRVPMSPNPVSARRLAPGELYANRPVPMPYQSPAAFNQRVQQQQQGQQLRQQQGQQRRQQQQQQIYPTNMYTPTTYAAAPAPTAYPQYAGPANNAAAAAAYARQFGGARTPNAQAGEIPAPRGRAPAPGPRGSSRGAAGRAGERSGYVRVRRDDGDDGAGGGNARRGDREDAAPGISSSRARPPRGASIGRQLQQPQRRPVQTNTQPDDGPRRVRPPRAAAEAPPGELQPRQQDPVRRPPMQASVAVLQRQPQPRPVPQAQAQPVRNTEEFDVVGAYMSSSAGTERSTFPALAGVPRSASLQRKIGSGGGVAESVKQNAYQGDEQPSAARQRAQRAGAAPAASGQTGRSEPRGDAQPGFRRPTQPTALKPPAPSTPGGPPAMLTPVSSVDSIVGPNTAAREAVPAPGSEVPAAASSPPTGAAIPLTMLQDPTEFQRAAAKTPISTREATRRQQALEREIAAAVASATVKHASKDLTASDASVNSSRRVSTGSGNQGQPGASSMRVDNGRQKTSNFDAQANRNTAATSVSAVGSLSKEYAWLNESTARSATGGASSVGTSQKSVTGSYDWRGARVYDAAAAIQARNIQGQARNRSRG